MIHEMIFRLVFSFSSFFFLLLLLVAYLSKKFNHKLRNKIYIYFLTMCVIVVLSEIATYMYLAAGNNQLIYTIFAKINCASVIGWGWLLLCYCYALIYKPEETKFWSYVKNNKLILVGLIIGVIAAIASIFVNTPALDERVVNFLANDSFVSVAYYILTTFVILVLYFIKFKKLDFKEKVILMVIILEVPLFHILQAFLPQVSFMSLYSCIQVVVLFFYYENPDLFLINEMSKANIEQEKLNSSRSEFLVSIACDIKKPVNNLVNEVNYNIDAESFDKDEFKAKLESIIASSNDLIEIVDNGVNSQTILENEDYSFNNLINDLVNEVKKNIGDKQINVITNIEEGIPTILNGDYNKLYKVLSNIVINAALYTVVGRITINVNKKIDGNKILLNFKITDTGNGISEEERSHVFEKYSTSNRNGLGLVIVKKNINILGGRVWFESTKDVGTSFYVDVTQNISNDQTKVVDIQLNKLTNKKVLIVDDDLASLVVTQKILSKYGIDVDTCLNGSECLYKIKEGNNYDLIFMDQIMRECTGLETFKDLQGLRGTYKVPPVVAFTANAINGAKEMYLNQGFNDYLSKPINKRELEKIINKYLVDENREVW